LHFGRTKSSETRLAEANDLSVSDSWGEAVASSAPLATPMNKNVFVRSAICTTLSSVRLCVRRSVTLCTVVKRCILQNEWEVPSKNTLSLKHTVNQRTDKIVHVWNSHRQHAVYERFSQAISALLLIFCHFLTFIPLMTVRVFWHLRQNHLRQRSPTEASISGINGTDFIKTTYKFPSETECELTLKSDKKT